MNIDQKPTVSNLLYRRKPIKTQPWHPQRVKPRQEDTGKFLKRMYRIRTDGKKVSEKSLHEDRLEGKFLKRTYMRTGWRDSF